MLAIKFILLLLSVFMGYFLGYFLTETKYRLARFSVFQMTVWECRKCLSTHIAWVSSTLISLIFGDWVMLIIGLMFAGGLFLGLYLDEKHKTITIEEYNTLNT